MHHRDRTMQSKDLVQAAAIQDIAELERAPLDCPPIACRQIVVGDRDEARLSQGLAGVASDIAGATGHKYTLAHGFRHH